MNTVKKTATILKDPKINIKIKLAGLWASVMFIFIYVDYFALYIPGVMEKIAEGEVAHTGIEITQVFLLAVIILMIIPSLMIFLSLVLKAKANRLTNIIASIFKIVVVVGALIGEIWIYYIFASIVELVLLSLIVWYAWKWPVQEA
jgi:heme/copper-type cytochrome/quinol oxidase subunit 4